MAEVLVEKMGISRPGAIAKLYVSNRALISGVISVLAIVLLWEIVGRYVLTSKVMFAPLTAVFQAGMELASTGELWRHMQISYLEFAVGFCLAAISGIGLGLLVADSKRFAEYVEPVINIMYSMPYIALAPLFIVWFGIDIASKIAVVALSAFFPIIINTIAGIRSTEGYLVEAARACGASRAQIFYKVLLPYAVPFVATGLRLGVARGVVGVVAGELFGARAGLGYLIVVSGQTFNMPGLFVGVLMISATGVFLVTIIQRVEDRLAHWRGYKI